MDSLDYVCNSFHSCHGFAVQLVDSFHCSVWDGLATWCCTCLERFCKLYVCLLHVLGIGLKLSWT